MSALAVLRTALMVLVLAGPAWGQSASAPDTTADAVDAEVEIIAHLPGPALWRVTTARSELWIIGMTGPTPKSLAWDMRRFETALSGAQELVIPPGASIGVVEAAGLLFDPARRYHYPGGQTLRGSMNAERRARFEAAARSVGQDPAHYDHWRPLVVSVALLADTQKHDALNAQGPLKTMTNLARARGVRVRRLANYSIGDMLRAFNNAAPDAPDVCLNMTVDLIPRLPAYASQLGQAWARGDVKGTLSGQAEITADRCFIAVPGILKLQDRVMQDWARGLAATLKRPGKTVLAVDMLSLTRPGGLLDQLRAQGLEVTGRAY